MGATVSATNGFSAQAVAPKRATNDGEPGIIFARKLLAAGDTAATTISHSGINDGSIGFGLVLAHEAQAGSGGGTPPLASDNADLIVVHNDQSNVAYALNNSAYYTGSADQGWANPTTGDVTYYRGSEQVPIDAAATSGKKVTPGAAWLAEFCEKFAPGRKVHIVDWAESGSSRYERAQDGYNSANIMPGFLTALGNARTAAGSDYKEHVQEFMTASDMASLSDMLGNFGPHYLGEKTDGTLAEVGAQMSSNRGGYRLDHILWDVRAPSLAEKGRGIFPRTTTWTTQFTGNDDIGVQQGMLAFRDDPRMTPMKAPLGSIYAMHFAEGGHPYPEERDGGLRKMMEDAPSYARLLGTDVFDPELARIEVPLNGAYADLWIRLLNRGVLTTIEAREGRAPHGVITERMAGLVGVDMQRAGETGGALQALWRTNAAAKPAANRGVAAIIEAAATDGGERFGIIRVTPEQRFRNGDLLSMLNEKRLYAAGPAKEWLHIPIETVPAMYFPSMKVPYPGIPPQIRQPQFAIETTDAEARTDIWQADRARTSGYRAPANIVWNNAAKTLSWDSASGDRHLVWWLSPSMATVRPIRWRMKAYSTKNAKIKLMLASNQYWAYADETEINLVAGVPQEIDLLVSGKFKTIGVKDLGIALQSGARITLTNPRALV